MYPSITVRVAWLFVESRWGCCSPWSWNVRQGWTAPRGCQELNSGPLQEKQMLGPDLTSRSVLCWQLSFLRQICYVEENLSTLLLGKGKSTCIFCLFLYIIFLGSYSKSILHICFWEENSNKWLLLLISNSAVLCSDGIPHMIWVLLSRPRFFLRIYLVFLLTFLVVPLTKASFVSIYQYLINLN